MFNIIDLILEDNLNRCIQKNGLEGTEDAINRVYKHYPKAKEAFLKLLKKRLK